MTTPRLLKKSNPAAEVQHQLTACRVVIDPAESFRFKFLMVTSCVPCLPKEFCQRAAFVSDLEWSTV